MFLHYSKIITLDVADLRSQSNIGSISDLVLNNENLSLIGLTVKKQRMWQNNVFVIPVNDIIEIENKGVIVSSIDSLVPLKETIRIKKQVENGYLGVGQKVITKSGQYIGKVFDYILDNKSLLITKIYTQNMMKERIISINNIVSYSENVIVINDDDNYVKISAVSEISTI